MVIKEEQGEMGTETSMLPEGKNDESPMTHHLSLHRVVIMELKKDPRTMREGIGWLQMVVLGMGLPKRCLDETETNADKLKGKLVAEAVFTVEAGILCSKFVNTRETDSTIEKRDDCI